MVYLNDRKKLQNKLFLFLCFSISLWSLLTYISTKTSDDLQIYFVRLVIGSAAMMMYAILVNFVLFPDHQLKQHQKLVYGSGFYYVLVFILTQTPFVFSALQKNEEGNLSPVISYGMPVFASFVFFCLVYSAINLIRKYKNSYGLFRKQLRLIIIGIFVTITAIIITNFLLPNLASSTKYIKFGPAFTLFFTFSFAYALARHKLFDIKTIVVRSFVYTITTTVLVAMYSGISLPIKNFLISVNTESYVSTLVEIVLLGIFGMSFYPLKLYFDRVTTKYFFRDHYNPQEVLKNINSVISGSVDLNKMLRRVGGMIKDTLLIDHCTFIIMEVDATEHIRYINVGKSVENVVLPDELDKLFRRGNVVVADQLGDKSKDLALKSSLLGQDIAVVVKLKGINEQGHVEDQGYIVLGSKKSGKGFSGQDEKMLEILSSQLAVAVQNLVHLDEIVHFNIKLQDEVRDATKELKVKNKKLQELDETKDEFVSMASHQLRTPLTSVKGYLSMVLEGDAGELKPAQKDLLEQAFTSTQRMVYLIADLLNLSRLKTGKFVITPQSTSLASMIESEIHQVQETAKTKDLEVSFMCDPSIPNLMLDDMKTRQVIMNFIDNAIYYTPGGGHIKVLLEKSGDKAIFKVQDDGIGVSKADQKELFGKFFRAGNAKARRPDGTGLGLYMAKMIIDAQGGEIIFESEEGKGSTFGFKFDISKLESKI